MKYFSIIVCFFIISCDYFQPREKSDSLVRVGDHYLHQSDLAKLGIGDMDPADSAKMVTAYINSWIKNETYLQHSKKQLSEAQLLELKQKVDDYEQSLYTHIYEEQMIKERLDTIVSEDELRSYYEENTADFIIQEPIVKFVSLKRDQAFNNKNEINIWLNEMIEDGNDSLIKEYCTYNTIDCYLDIDSWVKQNTFFETINAEPSKKNIALQKNRLYEFENSKYFFLYKIIDIQTNGYYPFEFVQDNIKKVILYKREKEFLELLRSNILETAKENNEIEIYE